MIHLNYSDMDRTMTDAAAAYEYAKEHFEELRNRPISYTLFGPDTYGIGAACPTITKDRARKLQKRTRCKKYLVYSLDENYRVLSTRHQDNTGNIECTLYHFELNGIQYAPCFYKDTDGFYPAPMRCLKMDGKQPVFYAEASSSVLFVELYEPISQSDKNKVLACEYFYYPTRMYSKEGFPIDRDAPYNSPNSPVTFSCCEKTLPNIDFTKWFV